MTPERRRDARLVPVLLAISLCLTIVAIAISIASLVLVRKVDANASKIKANSVALVEAQRTQRRAELNQCARVQVLRDRVNTNAKIIYRVLDAAGKSARRRGERDVARAYALFRAQTLYQPHTNCDDAINRPLTYRTPPPISMQEYFAKHRDELK